MGYDVRVFVLAVHQTPINAGLTYQARMTHITGRTLAAFLNRQELLDSWLDLHLLASSRRGLVSEGELRSQFARSVEIFFDTLMSSETLDASHPEWQPVLKFLTDLTERRATQGFNSTETALFVLSLKQPLDAQLREHVGDATALADASWQINLLLDSLGLYTTEVYRNTREAVLSRQREALLELSTPVVELWDGILMLPLVGTLDSARAQFAMENLLEKIVETRAAVSIIDITGVPVVDTLVADHVIKTVAAVRLMGNECVLSGIRAQIAQTVVHLGINLSGIVTRASLSDAFAFALKHMQRTAPGTTSSRRAGFVHDRA